MIQPKKMIEALTFWLLLPPFLCALGLVLFGYELQCWRYWHNVQCRITFFDGGEWVSVEE